MHKEKQKISCPTFKKQEPIIKNITDKINMAKQMQEKARFAEELENEVDVILSCTDYKEESLECKNCHIIAKLRKKTANLIIKTRKLG